VAAGKRDDSRKAASRYGWPACNRGWRRLQPWVAEAATVGGGGCNRGWRRLQPWVAEAATLCEEGVTVRLARLLPALTIT
jgi:hypothetical protein